MIIVNQDSTNINIINDLLIVSVNQDNPNILSPFSTPIISSNTPVLNVVAISDKGVVKAIGEQGPSGPPGLSAGGELIHIAPINLGGGRVVTSAFNYADSLDPNSAAKVIGFTQGAAAMGELVSIMLSGELGGFFGLTPNGIIYLFTNGTITQIPPTLGYIQKLGVALDSTTILINIQEPIIL